MIKNCRITFNEENTKATIFYGGPRWSPEATCISTYMKWGIKASPPNAEKIEEFTQKSVARPKVSERGRGYSFWRADLRSHLFVEGYKYFVSVSVLGLY